MNTNIRKNICARREDLVYPDLSYDIIGVAFDVYNQLGLGHREEVYQRALGNGLREGGIKFQEQTYFPVLYKGKVVGRNFFDFLVEDKIVIEIKKGSRFSKSNIDQVFSYLVASKLKLALLIHFGSEGVLFKRIVNE